MTRAKNSGTETPRRIAEEKIEIGAPVEAVWRALTEAEEIERWFAPEARVTPGAGGKIWWHWQSMFEWEQRIEIWEPNRHLRTTYAQVGPGATPQADIDPQSQPQAVHLAIDFHLEGRGGITVLRVVHSGFGADASWDMEYDGVRRGWHFELRSLRHYLERHPGVERKVAWVRKAIELTAEEAWARLLDGNGFTSQLDLSALKPGSEYSLAVAGDVFRGAVTTLNPPYEFSGTVANLSDALLRIAVEPGHGDSAATLGVWLWVATWGLSQASVDAIYAQLQALLDRLFPEEEGR
ncbi:MAG: SRPBCC domain-containing protein [Gemmatimonadetes bacterium]|uniref:SRPBCC domain-containing protein n=1 Tax=Candidatus Kutchimonas denitrificans TaxID=3056748 RepID=A0AAE4Z7B8_9BACT|nr:SRPBCC domain-containing protein [Gemmatimonadota bacterium]NIR73566.1 SRPBCC domain-containing protein [Candidatus Kutchimonas denitrificans]NIR99525.1 SRPBCC domain-containing protein [Gemmatimonadota bacterium]NIT65145.1 SRPBCC domain-containing protein [Gemmatimonadota bacterium]NIV23678.1 hypothetical protein [Gemmatimonadota bacterium]